MRDERLEDELPAEYEREFKRLGRRVNVFAFPLGIACTLLYVLMRGKP